MPGPIAPAGAPTRDGEAEWVDLGQPAASFAAASRAQMDAGR